MLLASDTHGMQHGRGGGGGYNDPYGYYQSSAQPTAMVDPYAQE